MVAAGQVQVEALVDDPVLVEVEVVALKEAHVGVVPRNRFLKLERVTVLRTDGLHLKYAVFKLLDVQGQDVLHDDGLISKLFSAFSNLLDQPNVVVDDLVLEPKVAFEIHHFEHADDVLTSYADLGRSQASRPV